jgi:hypothetical protein
VKQNDIVTDNAVLTRLLTPERLYTRDEVLDRSSPVPRVPGIYAWYFDELPPGVDVSGCHVIPQGTLLYVGIAPKEPYGSPKFEVAAGRSSCASCAAMRIHGQGVAGQVNVLISS